MSPCSLLLGCAAFHCALHPQTTSQSGLIGIVAAEPGGEEKLFEPCRERGVVPRAPAAPRGQGHICPRALPHPGQF